MLVAISRSLVFRVISGLVLFATPFVVMSLTDQAGTRRGLWVSLIGAVVGALVERPFRPTTVLTSKRWVGRRQWLEIAVIVGTAMGLLLSIADQLGQGKAFTTTLEELWIPLYRALLFTIGLALIRRAVWERGHAARAHVHAHAHAPAESRVPITPALPRRRKL